MVMKVRLVTGRSVAGVGGQDASSTATIGSNLLYLSDEQVALSLEVVGVE